MSLMDSDDVLSPEVWELHVVSSLRSLERAYFSEIEPVSSIEIVNTPPFPARYLPATKIIQLNAELARFPRLAQVLILHELINHKCSVQNPNYAQNAYGKEFQVELTRLLEARPY